MVTPVKKIIVGGAAVVAAALLLASTTWACTALPGIISVKPGAGQPGSTVEVEGRGFKPPDGTPPMEIRWDSTSGVVLTTATGENFRVSFAVPPTAQPRHYTVLAVQRNTNGALLGRSAVQFRVTAAAPVQPPPEPVGGAVDLNVVAPDVLHPTPAVVPATASPPAAGGPARARQEPAPAPAGAPAGLGSPGAARPTGVPGLVGAATTPSTVARAGAPAFLAPAEATAPDMAAPPDVRDLWSGVEKDGPASGRASLLAPTRPDSGISTGAGLLGLATMALLAAAALTLLPRRRAVARPNGRGRGGRPSSG